METIKKRILQKTKLIVTNTTGHTIVNDTNAIYYIVIGLVSAVKDVGFFDSYVEPHAPYYPYYPYGAYGGITIPIGLENLM